MKSLLVIVVIALCDCGLSLAAKCVTVFQENGIVPDILDVPPNESLKIEYPNGVQVNFGNELTPRQVKDKPTLDWPANPQKLYTLLMVDPDVQSRANPTERSINHWTVINISGNNINSGNEIVGYLGSAPSNGTELHRYVFLMYEQPHGHIQYDGPITPSNSIAGRPRTDVREYTRNLTLGDPRFGNFYVAQFDDSVPAVHAALGIPN